MSEPTSDALFGADGTELPRLRPDPSGRSSWRDAPELPPLTLPAAPDTSTLREAFAAAVGAAPTGSVDQDPGAVPPPVAQHKVRQPSVPQDNVPKADNTATLPALSAPQADPSGPGKPRVAPAQVSPAQVPPRSPGGLRDLSPLAAGARTPVQLVDLRRGIGRIAPGAPHQSRSNGGAGTFCVIMLIIFAVLLYGIITDIVEAIYRLLP